jgi:cytoskeletal protein CcmA (bactofilin family)
MFAKKVDRLESFIGTNSVFKGDIETKGTLRIDGTLNGNVNADWVILSEKAILKGDITARGSIMGGKMEGNLKVKELVEVKSKGVIIGDVYTSKLSIVEGGVLNGRVSMQADGSKIIDFQAKES